MEPAAARERGPDDDMTAQRNKPAAIRVVMPFVTRHWLKQPVMTAIVAFGLLGATVTDLFMPLYSGHLVDALTLGADNASARETAWSSFAAIVALGFFSIVLRMIGLQAIVPFTLRIMSDVAQDAFVRVQRFSTDWHANSFAGSTVRKVTRGMWALDLYNDTILLALLPSLMVLLGSMVLLGLHWTSLGLVIAGRAHLRLDDGSAHDTLHRARCPGFQRLGHQGRRHAGGCLDLQRGGEVLWRGGAGGHAIAACGQPLAGKGEAHLAAL